MPVPLQKKLERIKENRYIIGLDQKIHYSRAHPDYTKGPSPSEILSDPKPGSDEALGRVSFRSRW